ncbi:MAG: FAD-dependent oxidoreductase, partial [Microcoleaceae cyanobacterium]
MSSPVQILFLFTLLLIPLKFWLPASTIENISNQISSLGQPNIAPTPIEPDVIPVAYRHFDIVVYGDELPGICAAIWARKTLGPDQKIALVRQQDESALFGGLLTRGGLSYLDFDKTPYWAEQPYSQCFQEFIKRSEIAEACVEPVKASQAIAQMLEEANITILHGVTLQPKVEATKIKYVKVNYPKSVNTQKDLRIKSEIYIDATQNAELAQKAGVKYDLGYASQNPKLSQETLAVSIVPVIEGLTIDELRNIEYQVLDNYSLMNNIANSIKENQPEKAANFWLSNFDLPIFQRYVDGYYQKSIALGGAYHLWRKQPFQKTNFLFDKGNICVQKPQSLSWNGFLFKYSTDEVLQLEKDNLRPNPTMVQEMQQLEQWFSQLAGKPVKVIIPPEIYVRHSLSINDVVDPLSGQ